MGKYLRKAKIAGDVALMEVISQSSIGVRTRAKTLALQRLQSAAAPPQASSDSSYLQLRSRRLPKAPLDQRRQARDCCAQNPNSLRRSANACSRSVSINVKGDIRELIERGGEGNGTQGIDDVEPSFGENYLEFEGRERSTRESTPCSLIRESDASAPGSTSRQTISTAANRRTQNPMQGNVPTTQEIEEFFAYAEQQQQQQRLFTEKYNFDIRHDSPLPGRYKWVRVNQ
ncbi:cyclin-dependent kinase inhibitor 5-like [Diospyros lotus]|uniref:cyclin-dependent kinase inhibitor 5-like n=1 Tax=Diospyros lotus TaxID=55363 RepID=UPI002253DAE5|nr:cyclin-dependent kinase inhibitor 5-like [Diospyros lotus]